MARFAAATVTADEIVKELDTAGFCFVEDVLTAAEADATREELRGILMGGPTGRNAFEGYKTRRMYGLFAKTRRFDRLATHPVLLEVIERALGTEHFNLSAPTGIDIGPGERPQIPHRDDGKYPIPQPHQEVIVNMMWALDDFTERNGATLVWPGTQAGGRAGSYQYTPKRTHEVVLAPDRRHGTSSPPSPPSDVRTGYDEVQRAISDADVQPVKAIMRKGSVLVYKGSLLHGGGANETSRHRMGVILEYCAGWLRPQENHALAVPRDTAAKLSPRLQELLGYNMVPPFIGYVDGRHPRESLGVSREQRQAEADAGGPRNSKL